MLRVLLVVRTRCYNSARLSQRPSSCPLQANLSRSVFLMFPDGRASVPLPRSPLIPTGAELVMAKRSKFFCIAVEGATCDGRTLDANALQEMADTYDPATYQARINMEHIRGFSAEPPFNAYGDVVALETRSI